MKWYQLPCAAHSNTFTAFDFFSPLSIDACYWSCSSTLIETVSEITGVDSYEAADVLMQVNSGVIGFQWTVAQVGLGSFLSHHGTFIRIIIGIITTSLSSSWWTRYNAVTGVSQIYSAGNVHRNKRNCVRNFRKLVCSILRPVSQKQPEYELQVSLQLGLYELIRNVYLTVGCYGPFSLGIH